MSRLLPTQAELAGMLGDARAIMDLHQKQQEEQRKQEEDRVRQAREQEVLVAQLLAEEKIRKNRKLLIIGAVSGTVLLGTLGAIWFRYRKKKKEE